RLSGAGWRYHKVRGGETWASISKKTGIPVSILRQLNPQKLKKGQSLRMPSVKGSVPPFEPMVPNYEPAAKTSAANAQQNVTAALAELEGKVSAQEEVSFEPVVQRTHKIKSGDTLSGIAKKYGTTVREIYKANGGQDKLKTLRIGQIVKLPYTKAQLEQLEQQRKEKARRAEEARKAAEARAKAELAKATSHKVQKGDTLSGIARKYGVTVKDLQHANGGANKLKTLRIGQEIALPTRGKAVQAAPVVEKAVKPAAKAEPAAKAPVKHEEPRAATARPSEHKVQSGDTLSRIARKYGVTVKELQQANGGADKLKTLRIGQVIAIPAQAGEAETEAAAAALSELKAAAGQKAVTAVPAAPVVVPAPKPAVAPASASAPAAVTSGIENYKVQSGDSIWRISRRFGMSVDEFKSLNEGIDSSSLRLGATVRVIRRK
ncbi:MAG: LysM peptidoglycan-binding domain-containing protein, partial [Mailhella sp.]|nr:LysM peptidoglycan-binding domain-containing protein [Mailhella sp.]